MDRITLVDSGACSRDMFVLVKSLETARTTEEEGRVVRVQAKLWTKSLRGGHLSTVGRSHKIGWSKGRDGSADLDDREE